MLRLPANSFTQVAVKYFKACFICCISSYGKCRLMNIRVINAFQVPTNRNLEKGSNKTKHTRDYDWLRALLMTVRAGILRVLLVSCSCQHHAHAGEWEFTWLRTVNYFYVCTRGSISHTRSPVIIPKIEKRQHEKHVSRISCVNTFIEIATADDRYCRILGSQGVVFLWVTSPRI